MLNDRRISKLVDYPNAAEVFPSVGINGGISYFLWEAHYDGDCETTMIRGSELIGPHIRRLHEFDVFIRDYRAVDILKKVHRLYEPSMSELVSPRDPFGPALSSNFTDYRMNREKGDLQLHLNLGTKRETAWVQPHFVTKNHHLVQAWKVLIPKAGSGREREKSGVDIVLGPPLIASPGAVCTLTYVVAGPLDTREAAASLESYLKTRFLRFLVSLRKISQDAPRGVYAFVPQQAWDRTWTDADLYKKYGITKNEVDFIESMIRPMGEGNDE
jgi:site-specific DNA-methyltransferase (adenine-specific)